MKIKTGKTKKPGKTVRELTVAAGNAMKNGFYTEAIWILSAIMEIRLKKIIMITEDRNPGAAFDLEKQLKRIKWLQAREKYSLLKDQFPADLLQSLRTWKNNRNILMKDMLEMHVSFDRKERMAKEGISLFKELNKIYKHYRLAAGEINTAPFSREAETTTKDASQTPLTGSQTPDAPKGPEASNK